MATEIMMKHPETGIIKKGFYGFSWTTLFFIFMVPFSRGELKEGIMLFLACAMSGGLAGVVWAFIYNKKYTLDLVEKGYKFMGTEREITRAKENLGIALDS